MVIIIINSENCHISNNLITLLFIILNVFWQHNRHDNRVLSIRILTGNKEAHAEVRTGWAAQHRLTPPEVRAMEPGTPNVGEKEHVG